MANYAYVGTCPLLLAARLPGRISAPTDADMLRSRCLGPSCAWWRAGCDCCAVHELARGRYRVTAHTLAQEENMALRV